MHSSPSRRALRASSHDDEEVEEDEEHCLICCEPLRDFVVGACNHAVTCATCTVRLRGLYSDLNCTLCKVRRLEMQDASAKLWNRGLKSGHIHTVWIHVRGFQEPMPTAVVADVSPRDKRTGACHSSFSSFDVQKLSYVSESGW